MTMQVVDASNLQQFVETRSVPEFKPPEKTEPKDVVARDDAGKFVSVEPGKEKLDAPSEKADKSDAPVPTGEALPEKRPDDPAGDDDDLPEKVRKKIGAKHRQMKEAEEHASLAIRRRLEAEERAEALQRQLDARGEPKSGPASEKDSQEPKAEDFKTVGEYADALVKFRVDKALAERDSQAEQTRQQTAQDQAKAKLQERVAQAAKDIPDYADVMASADMEAPAHVANFIMESDMGPQVGYHLVKNRAEFDRIAKLSPIRAIAELGKLEATLSKAATPSKEEPKAEAAKTPAVSKAPSPITPLDASGKTVVHKDPSTMSFRELREHERQKDLERRRR
jgi:hypothetical protein